MKINMTTSEVVDLFKNITDFLKKDMTLSRQFVWDLEDNYEIMKKIVDRFEKHRDELFSPLSEKNAFEVIEDGKVRVKNEYRDEFIKANNEAEEYLNTVNDIEIKTVDKNSVPDNLSVNDWRAIKFMCV